jgi:hypothetical protein
MTPWTSDTHDAAATPIHPVLRSTTMRDHVADATDGNPGIANAVTIAARRSVRSMGPRRRR